MSQTMAEVQKNLRKIRKSKGLTLHGVEALSNGLHKAVVIGSYERGSRAISVDKLISLAEFYETPVSEFFGPTKPEPKMVLVPFEDLQKLLASTGQVIMIDELIGE
jgi:transcriptional regulator with XRE-family HTH domain